MLERNARCSRFSLQTKGAISQLEPLAQPGKVCQMALYTARSLKNYRSSCLADDSGKIFGRDLAIAQVGVPINSGVEVALRVIGVYQVNPSGDGSHSVGQAGQFFASGEGVAGIKTKSDALIAIGGAEGIPKFL